MLIILEICFNMIRGEVLLAAFKTSIEIGIISFINVETCKYIFSYVFYLHSIFFTVCVSIFKYKACLFMIMGFHIFFFQYFSPFFSSQSSQPTFQVRDVSEIFNNPSLKFEYVATFFGCDFYVYYRFVYLFIISISFFLE